MSEEAREYRAAHALPEGDGIRILLEQHARVRELFATVNQAQAGEAKSDAFDDLRALLAVHETAEEMVLRPVSRRSAGGEVADERNQEEAKANEVLKKLEMMDVNTPEFNAEFADFEKSVDAHAKAEEREEFPAVIESTDDEQRQRIGKMLSAAEKMAPTHAHPSAAGSTVAQITLGPFASMVDRARDAISSMAS